MFQPLHILNNNTKEIEKYQERWKTNGGEQIQNNIIDKIKNGAGEDFLQSDFQNGELPILENEWDLKGIELWKLDINFPKNDTFEAIDFSYARFWHSKFKNAAFVGGGGGVFTRIYNCEFIDCLFYLCGWRGCTFEKVKFTKCDFMEHTYFVNCVFIDCQFDKCFLFENIFSDCFFNINTTVGSFVEKTNNFGNHKSEPKNLSEIYKGIKDSYGAGEVYEKYRNYFFKQKHTETKILKKGLHKVSGLIQESFTGYGVKPIRVLEWSLFTILLFTNLFVFLFKQTITSALIQSLSAFATMGDIPTISIMNFLYLTESLLGIFFFALFVTVLSNVWFGEK